jgi:hypothetical protein
MPYESFCHTCNRPFSKTLTPTEYKEGMLWQRGSGADMVFTSSRLSRARKQLE